MCAAERAVSCLDCRGVVSDASAARFLAVIAAASAGFGVVWYVDAKVMTIKAVAERYDVSWWLVMRTVKAWSGQLESQRRRRRCTTLLVDETSLRCRHRYVTVVSDGDTAAQTASRESSVGAGGGPETEPPRVATRDRYHR